MSFQTQSIESITKAGKLPEASSPVISLQERMALQPLTRAESPEKVPHSPEKNIEFYKRLLAQNPQTGAEVQRLLTAMKSEGYNPSYKDRIEMLTHSMNALKNEGGNSSAGLAKAVNDGFVQLAATQYFYNTIQQQAMFPTEENKGVVRESW